MQLLKCWFQNGVENAAFMLGPAELTEALKTERRRADRSHAPLAMVTFQRRGSQPDSLPSRLSEALQHRLRETDAAGLLDAGRRLAVVMPDTTSEGARTFASAILEQSETRSEVRVEVYLYPEMKDLEGPDCEPRDDDHDGEVSHKELEPLLVVSLPVWKRALDVAAASMTFVLLLPVMIMTGIAVRLSSAGPILFCQQRAGRGGKPFTLYKFRTMCVDAESQQAQLQAKNEQDGPAFKIKHDPRITPIGRYLRRTCLDELPQLWNVIRGDMTLVGPRPLPCRETDQCRGWERRRLEVTPGLTCIWQVDGGTRVSFAEWMRMDIRYINSRRIAHDVSLLWRTAVKVMLHRASH